MSDLTPDQRAEAARQLIKLLQGEELGEDEEVFYYLFPFTEDLEMTDEADKAGKPPEDNG
jgi:hypothetical protein